MKETKEKQMFKAELNLDKDHLKHPQKGYLYFEDLAEEIKANHPEVIGKHIFEQIEALGLTKEFNESESPCSLPYTFY